MDVSVIIVNYKTRDLTLQCLRTLFCYTHNVEMEVILVDNASSDDTPMCVHREFPQVRVIESSENLGFGRANNLGSTYAVGKYLFLLNSDTIILHNIVRQFFDFMEGHPEYASCGGNLLDGNGVNCGVGGNFPTLMQEFLNIGFYRLIPKHIWYSYSAVQTIANCNPQNILHVTGADTFIRKDVFDKFGGFDPNFFMYNEEVELFYRMHQAGLRACVLPYAVMIHLDGASFDGKKRLAFLRRNEYALKSKFYFYRKHRGRRELLIVKILVFISAILHFYTYRTYLLSYLIKIITW